MPVGCARHARGAARARVRCAGRRTVGRPPCNRSHEDDGPLAPTSGPGDRWTCDVVLQPSGTVPPAGRRATGPSSGMIVGVPSAAVRTTRAACAHGAATASSASALAQPPAGARRHQQPLGGRRPVSHLSEPDVTDPELPDPATHTGPSSSDDSQGSPVAVSDAVACASAE